MANLEDLALLNRKVHLSTTATVAVWYWCMDEKTEPWKSRGSRERPAYTATGFMTKGHQRGKDFQKFVLCQFYMHLKEMNCDPYHTPSEKSNSTWIIDLHVKGKALELL
jgi:hypothetical protein